MAGPYRRDDEARGAPEVAMRREMEEVGILLDSVQSLGILTGRQAYRRDTVHVFFAQSAECNRAH